MTSKVELVTQPPKDSEASPRDEALRKLRDLVQENIESENSTQDKSQDSVLVLNKDKSSGLDYSKETLHESSTRYDEDGFEIPLGKIPLDGHFSTEEVKELVEISKEEGVLKSDVNVNIVEHSDAVGDRIEIAEEEEGRKKAKEKEKEEKDKEEY